MRNVWMMALVLMGCTGEPQTTDEPIEPITLEGWGSLDIDTANAQRSAWQIIDTRSEAAYSDLHIPGAIHFDSNTLRAEINGIPNQLLGRTEAVDLFEAAGIDAGAPTLIYGSVNDSQTTRVLYTLALYGSTDALYLLDGGVNAWLNAGYPINSASVQSGPPTWQGGATLEELRVEKDWILDHLDDTDVTIFDTRSATEYAAGHIPGAINVDWIQNLDANGFFLRSADVLSLHGNPSTGTTIVYCQNGARATVTWSLLTFAGLSNVRLYDGSWNEWGTDPDTPKEIDEP